MTKDELVYLYNECVDTIEEMKYNIYNAEKVIKNQNEIIEKSKLKIEQLKTMRDRYIKDLSKFYK